ncbi:MAG: SpoIIIAC/SpoIIIAD family protein [Candidatus Fimenecus sp.]
MLKLLLLVCIAAVLLTFVKQLRPEISVLLKFAVLIAILLLVMSGIQRCAESFSEIFRLANINSAYFTVMLKMLGLCITAQIAENICKDCGETALASTVETAAKCAILLVVLPVAKELVTICLGWLQ